MRYTILVLTLGLAAGAAEARADQLVSYHLTGTIDPGPWNPVGVSSSSFNGNGGDHISWTMQYDLSKPGTPNGDGSQRNYSLSGPVITNIVDETTGYHFPAGSITTSGLILGSNSHSSAVTTSMMNYGNYGNYAVQMVLESNSSLPTLNLAKVQLNSLPLNGANSYLGYDYQLQADTHALEIGIAFRASVDSISGPIYGAPEPGSLTLFLLGAAGLTVDGIRRRLRQLI